MTSKPSFWARLGAGKTTVLRRIMLEAAELSTADAGPITLPIFIRLNALTPPKTIEDLILDTFSKIPHPRFQKRHRCHSPVEHSGRAGRHSLDFCSYWTD